MSVQEQRTAIQRLSDSFRDVRNTADIALVRRHAEGIYNIAERNINELDRKIATRKHIFRCPNRLRWVGERINWLAVQDDCKEIVDRLSRFRYEA
jgi:hypothetical protein